MSSSIGFLYFWCFRCLFHINSRYWHEFRHRFSMFPVIPMLSHHKPVYCQEFRHRFSMFPVIPMFSLHKPVYCQEPRHRFSMLSMIPMPSPASIFKTTCLSDVSCLKEKGTRPIFQTNFSYHKLFSWAQASIFYFFEDSDAFSSQAHAIWRFLFCRWSRK